MRILCDQLLTYDSQFDKYRDTVVGDSIEILHKCGGRNANLLQCVDESTDSPFVRCYNDVDYGHQLAPIGAAHRGAEDGPLPTILSEAVGLSCSYDQLYFIGNRARWARGVHHEYRNRSGKGRQYISEWNDVALFDYPPSASSEYYVGILGSWQEEFECCGVLMVPPQPVFAYYSDLVLRCDGGAPVLSHISITDYLVIALPRILTAARDVPSVLLASIPIWMATAGVCLYHCDPAFAWKSMNFASSKLSVLLVSILSPG